MPRWQIVFSRGERVQWISHLDLLRAWQRTFRRAGVKLASSQGFLRHPKLGFASPLPVGVLGLSERLDVTIDADIGGPELFNRLVAAVPSGIAVSQVTPLEGPPLAARVHQALYRARLAEGLESKNVPERIRVLLSRQSLERERKRDKEVRRYDLRPLIDDIWIESRDGELFVWMRLRVGPAGAGRADDVLDALGLASLNPTIERVELLLRQ